MLSQDKKKPHMHELQKPAFLSLLFFPLGFWLAYRQDILGKLAVFLSIIILSFLLIVMIFIYGITDYLYVFPVVNFMGGVYLLGLVVNYTTNVKEKYRRSLVFVARWVSVPFFTIACFYTIIIKTMMLDKENVQLIWSVNHILSFLFQNHLFLFSFFAWSIFIIYSYVKPKKLEITNDR